MKNIKKKALTCLLALSIFVTGIPLGALDANASSASTTYDIEYSNGTITEDGNISDKEIDDYFTMKKIASYTNESGTITGSTITEEGECTQDANGNLLLTKSEYSNWDVAQQSYLLDYTAVGERTIQSYEITTSSGTAWAGLPVGLLFPIYYDSANQGYACISLATSGSKLTATYVWVGFYRVWARGDDIASASTGIDVADKTDADGNTISVSSCTIGIEYSYSTDGSTIESILLTVTPYYSDGSQGTVYQKTLAADNIISRINTNLAYNPSKTETALTSLASSGAVAGVISGYEDVRRTFAGIKVGLSKTDDELQGVVAEQLSDLYTAFQSEPNYANAEAYLAFYNTLSDEMKSKYATQLGDVISTVKTNLVDGLKFSMTKADFTDYPNLMEYIWPSSGTTTTTNTRVNAEVYDSTDVVKTTAVFRKSDVNNTTTNIMLQMCSDLAVDADTGSSITKDFGVIFWPSDVTFYADEEETSTTTVSLPLLYSKLLTADATNVVYQSNSGYGKDYWYDEVKSKTASSPLSYDEYTIVNASEYIAVELNYTATEYPDATIPHTKIEFTVKLWVDDGDGIYEAGTDVLLIDVQNRSGEGAETNYIAIAYLNGKPRVRQVALTKAGWDALVSIEMERIDGTQDLVGEKIAALYDAFLTEKSNTNAEAYLAYYKTLSEEKKSEYATQLGDIISTVKFNLVDGLKFSMKKTDFADCPNLMEYIWPSSGATSTTNTKVNAEIYNSTDVITTTAVFKKEELTQSAALQMCSDMAVDTDTGSAIIKDFGVIFWNGDVTFYVDETGTETTTVSLPLLYSQQKGTDSANVVYVSNQLYNKDNWYEKVTSETASSPLSYNEYTIVNASEYIAVELNYTATEFPDATIPHTKIEFTVKLWVDDGDGIYEAGTDVLLIDAQNRSGEDAETNYIAVAYLNGEPRVRQAALNKDAFDAMVSIEMERTDVDIANFKTNYAEILAMDVSRLAPYDVAVIDEMLVDYEALGEDIDLLSRETRDFIEKLETASALWNMETDATIAESYAEIHGKPEDESAEWDIKAAWNVYNRLTKNQKTLLVSEYDALVEALTKEPQVTGAIAIGWVGDYAPEGLADKLGDDYSVSVFEEGMYYDIVIIDQATSEAGVHSYLRMENTPFVVVTTNADSQTEAETNMSVATAYGMPCIDIYAYTNGGGTNIAGTYANAILSLNNLFATGTVTGFSFDESRINSFLTPQLFSATIKNTAVPAEQGLGFKTNINEYQKTGTSVVAYGTIFARYSSNPDISYDDMILENVNNGKYFNANISVTDDGELYGNSYIVGINLGNNEEFSRVYIARSYIKYADGTVYYSINTRTDLASSLATRTGVVNGYACRALTGVAKNMVIALAQQGIDISSVGSYSDENGLVFNDTATDEDAKAIFELLCSNQTTLDGIQNTVYLASTGSDDNLGTKNSPYLTLGKALNKVPDGGKIVVDDTVTIPSGFEWEERDKTITITGGTLDFATNAVNNVVIGDNVTFDDITLTFTANDTLYANGYAVKIGENVTMTNIITLYGGGPSGTTVEGTDLTVLAGTYKNIYGGSNQGVVGTAGTKLYVGGNVNKGSGAEAHTGSQYHVWAGGNADTINGNTECTFTDNAVAHTLYGGSQGTSTVNGVSNVTFSGGSIYCLVGGNNSSSAINGTNVTVTSGTIAQIFGANEGASMTGNVNLQLLGGTITRRVYGGCYNDYGTTSFSTNYYVTGNIDLTLGYDVTFELTDTDNEGDLSVYARSRHNKVSSSENSTIYWTSEAKGKHESTLGAQDEKMKAIMKTVLVLGTDITAADKFVVLNASE